MNGSSVSSSSTSLPSRQPAGSGTRLDKPELVEEAAHGSAGLRVMKGKQVATTSTSDLTEAGVQRFV